MFKGVQSWDTGAGNSCDVIGLSHRQKCMKWAAEEPLMFWIQQHLKGRHRHVCTQKAESVICHSELTVQCFSGSFLTASAAKQAADVLEKKLKKSSTTNTGSGLSNTRFTLDSQRNDSTSCVWLYERSVCVCTQTVVLDCYSVVCWMFSNVCISAVMRLGVMGGHRSSLFNIMTSS